MKRVRNVVLSFVVLCLVGFSGFGLIGCGCNVEQNESNLPEHIKQWRSGGIIAADGNRQLFANYEIKLTDTTPKFQGKIEIKPDTLEVFVETSEMTNYSYINFYTSPDSSQAGNYRYKITIFSLEELYEVEGELIVGTPATGIDKLEGGANRSRDLGEYSVENFSLVKITNLNKQSISNIAPMKDYLAAGSIGGDVFLISNRGDILLEKKVTDNAIEYIQSVDDVLIVATVDGEITTLELTSSETPELEQLSRTNINSRLSGIPTLITKDSMIIGTKSGQIMMLDVPNLSREWEYKATGSINGGACAVSLQTEGGLKSVIVASSDDRSVVYLDGDGTILSKAEMTEQLVSCTPAANGTKIVLKTQDNMVLVRSMQGTTVWGSATNHKIISGPAFNGKYVAVASETQTQLFNIDDESEQLLIEHRNHVSGEIFFMGENICIPTGDDTIEVYNSSFGNQVGKLRLSGTLKNTPVVLGNGMLVGVNDNSQLFFWGIPEKAENVGELDPESIVYPGGRGVPTHSNFVNTDLPLHQRRLLTIQGKFAPAIVSDKYLFLYNIDEERFSCRLRESGAEIWGIRAKAPFEEQFFGAGVDLGHHNSPIYYTPEGLILSTTDGLVQVDPVTGVETRRTSITGICNADGEVIIVANLGKLYCLDKNFNVIWEIDGSFYADSVCIDGDTVYAVDRREGNAKIYIINKQTGGITFTGEDESMAHATKLVATDKYVGFGSLGGVWLLHKNPPSIVGAVYGTSRSANLMVKDNDIITTTQIGDIMRFDTESYQDVPIQPPSSPDDKINWMYFDGNEIMTNNALVQIAKYLPDVPEGQKATEAQNQEVINNTHVMIRNPETGKPIFTELLDSSGASEFSLTIGKDVIAVCVHNGSEPKLMLFGE